MNATLNPRFRSGPWTGDTPAVDARDIDGDEVVERLATRDDDSSAVVRLASGRLAVLGDTVAIGAPRLLDLFAVRRRATVTAPADRAWWTEVRRAVAA